MEGEDDSAISMLSDHTAKITSAVRYAVNHVRANDNSCRHIKSLTIYFVKPKQSIYLFIFNTLCKY